MFDILAFSNVARDAGRIEAFSTDGAGDLFALVGFSAGDDYAGAGAGESLGNRAPDALG
jgi:hypothetical protein